jgi:hypothetical protein
VKYQYDYYQVLKVSEGEADDIDLLKKNYHQMALLIHPDKSSHPLATEAFKGLSLLPEEHILYHLLLLPFRLVAFFLAIFI